MSYTASELAKMLAAAKAAEEKALTPEEEAHTKAQEEVSYRSPTLPPPTQHIFFFLAILLFEKGAE